MSVFNVRALPIPSRPWDQGVAEYHGEDNGKICRWKPKIEEKVARSRRHWGHQRVHNGDGAEPPVAVSVVSSDCSPFGVLYEPVNTGERTRRFEENARNRR
jgi:hypothetical protein